MRKQYECITIIMIIIISLNQKNIAWSTQPSEVDSKVKDSR